MNDVPIKNPIGRDTVLVMRKSKYGEVTTLMHKLKGEYSNQKLHREVITRRDSVYPIPFEDQLELNGKNSPLYEEGFTIVDRFITHDNCKKIRSSNRRHRQ